MNYYRFDSKIDHVRVTNLYIISYHIITKKQNKLKSGGKIPHNERTKCYGFTLNQFDWKYFISIEEK